MPIGEVSGEFNNAVISSTFERQDGGGSQVVINIEGTGSVFGQTNGTLTLRVPVQGVTAGPGTFTGAAFQDTGEVVGLTGTSYWAPRCERMVWQSGAN